MTIGEIYAEHAPAVFRCLLVWSRNAAIAEDLTAETFYRAIVSGQTVRSMTARGYLIAIARNVWRKRLIRNGRESGLPADVVAPAPLSPEARIDLQRALQALAAQPGISASRLSCTPRVASATRRLRPSWTYP